jgi:hypothetical protein
MNTQWINIDSREDTPLVIVCTDGKQHDDGTWVWFVAPRIRE